MHQKQVDEKPASKTHTQRERDVHRESKTETDRKSKSIPKIRLIQTESDG